MTEKRKKTFLILFFVFFLSFLLNYFWESLHSFSLYESHRIDSGEYVLMISYMSMMDAWTVVGIYLTIALFAKDALWITQSRTEHLGWVFLLGLVVAAFAEYKAVYLTHEWHYNEYMPVILGVGLSPLIQLSITGIVSILLTKRLIKN